LLVHLVCETIIRSCLLLRAKVLIFLLTAKQSHKKNCIGSFLVVSFSFY
jgi:hypothetical protein